MSSPKSKFPDFCLCSIEQFISFQARTFVCMTLIFNCYYLFFVHVHCSLIVHFNLQNYIKRKRYFADFHCTKLAKKMIEDF